MRRPTIAELRDPGVLRRQAILRAGELGFVRTALADSTRLRPLIDQFLGGTDAASAVTTVARLRAEGIRPTLHLRLEPSADTTGVQAHVDDYSYLVTALAEAGLAEGAELSVKPEQVAWQAAALHQIAAAAQAVGMPITLDMQDRDHVNDTIDATLALRQDFPDTGVAIQANLHRSEADCATLAGVGSRVRLVKGGYQAPAEVAFTSRRDIDGSYLRCLKLLMNGEGYPMVATHDTAMIAAATDMATRAGRDSAGFEFQMLQGVREDEQRRLAARGALVRAYVAYGPDWYRWMVWLTSEKPSNLMLLARNARWPTITHSTR